MGMFNRRNFSSRAAGHFAGNRIGCIDVAVLGSKSYSLSSEDTFTLTRRRTHLRSPLAQPSRRKLGTIFRTCDRR
jgi:hypothetical protein